MVRVKKKGAYRYGRAIGESNIYYDLYIRDMLIRNLEKGQSLVDNGVLDWDLDINR